MSDQLQSAISQKLASFTKDLVELYRSALLDAVSQVVGGGAAAAPDRRGGRRRKKAGRVAVSKPVARGGRGRRRRTSAQIDATADKIQKFVSASPGKRAEEIKKALGIANNQWVLPVAKLLADKKIRTTGARRTTKYFPR